MNFFTTEKRKDNQRNQRNKNISFQTKTRNINRPKKIQSRPPIKKYTLDNLKKDLEIDV